jgi:hypothetical protein
LRNKLQELDDAIAGKLKFDPDDWWKTLQQYAGEIMRASPGQIESKGESYKGRSL